MNTSIASTPAPLPAGVGYLTFMGFFQIGVGALTVLFSIFAIYQGTVIDPQLFRPSAVIDASRGFWGRVFVSYIAFQMVFGWLVGVLMIFAGIGCLQLRRRALVTISTWLNFVNFPHGTMAAVFMFIGLGRPEVVEAFDRPPMD